MTTRQNDQDEVKVIRSIPLPWVITTLATLIFSSGVLYNSINEQTKVIAELSGSVKSLSAQLAAKDVRDMQQDTKIAEHERRLTLLETLRK